MTAIRKTGVFTPRIRSTKGEALSYSKQEGYYTINDNILTVFISINVDGGIQGGLYNEVDIFASDTGVITKDISAPAVVKYSGINASNIIAYVRPGKELSIVLASNDGIYGTTVLKASHFSKNINIDFCVSTIIEIT